VGRIGRVDASDIVKPLRLLPGNNQASERFLARRTSGNRYGVLRVHERGEVVLSNFDLKGAEKIGLFHKTKVQKRFRFSFAYVLS
jgi:hypothetical protein